MNKEFERYKEIVEEHLLDFIPEIDHKSITIYDAMKYSLAAGGKRLRPVLLLSLIHIWSWKRCLTTRALSMFFRGSARKV